MMNSREWKKARPPLLKAASKAKHGKLYAQLGQSYIQDEDWKNAEKYLVKAVEKGKLEKRESNTYLVLGITQARLGKFEKAIKTFRKAGDFDDTAKMRLNDPILKDSLLIKHVRKKRTKNC